MWPETHLNQEGEGLNVSNPMVVVKMMSSAYKGSLQCSTVPDLCPPSLEYIDYIL